MLESGDQAPDFTAPTQSGEPLTFSEFRGERAAVLYFFPRDGTPICTRQACGFRDQHEAFLEAGAVVLGVSGDSPGRHERFAAREHLPFPLVSDADGRIRELFGIRRRFRVFPRRVTFVVDQTGTVRTVIDSLFTAERHVCDALAAVRRLQRVTGT